MARPVSHAPMMPTTVPATSRRGARARNWPRICSGRTPMHAHADLAAALRHGVTQDTISADRDQQDRDQRKDTASNAGERCSTRLSAMRVSIDRSRSQAVRVDLPNQFLQRQPSDSGRSRCGRQ